MNLLRELGQVIVIKGCSGSDRGKEQRDAERAQSRKLGH